MVDDQKQKETESAAGGAPGTPPASIEPPKPKGFRALWLVAWLGLAVSGYFLADTVVWRTVLSDLGAIPRDSPWGVLAILLIAPAIPKLGEWHHQLCERLMEAICVVVLQAYSASSSLRRLVTRHAHLVAILSLAGAAGFAWTGICVGRNHRALIESWDTQAKLFGELVRFASDAPISTASVQNLRSIVPRDAKADSDVIFVSRVLDKLIPGAAEPNAGTTATAFANRCAAVANSIESSEIAALRHPELGWLLKARLSTTGSQNGTNMGDVCSAVTSLDCGLKSLKPSTASQEDAPQLRSTADLRILGAFENYNGVVDMLRAKVLLSGGDTSNLACITGTNAQALLGTALGHFASASKLATQGNAIRLHVKAMNNESDTYLMAIGYLLEKPRRPLIHVSLLPPEARSRLQDGSTAGLARALQSLLSRLRDSYESSPEPQVLVTLAQSEALLATAMLRLDDRGQRDLHAGRPSDHLDQALALLMVAAPSLDETEFLTYPERFYLTSLANDKAHRTQFMRLRESR